MSGGRAGVEAGTLSVMAAGDRGVLRGGLAPIAGFSATRSIATGTRLGQGAAIKVVNQLLRGVFERSFSVETEHFGERRLRPRLRRVILNRSAAASWMLRDRYVTVCESHRR
jgi:3-hydroxyisobutyrate dehydrogenase-like beta-hydroxyacid dehydrogenase